MNKLLLALVAGVLSVGALAQQTPAPVAAPTAPLPPLPAAPAVQVAPSMAPVVAPAPSVAADKPAVKKSSGKKRAAAHKAKRAAKHKARAAKK